MARSKSGIPAVFDRRAMLRGFLGAAALLRPSAARAVAQRNQYRRLRKPVVLPLDEVARSWQPVLFDAVGPARDAAAAYGPDVSLRGMLLRLPTTDGTTELKAFCLTCPHEICYVDYLTDTERVRLESAAKPEHPLFVCPCHFSVFNPLAEGAQISGPAHRGLYRFRLEVGEDVVEIKEVEDGALG